MTPFWQTEDAMNPKVDFPLPRIPRRTIEASGSKWRGYPLGRKAGAGIFGGTLLFLGVHGGLRLRDGPLEVGELGPWKASKDLFVPNVAVAMV